MKNFTWWIKFYIKLKEEKINNMGNINQTMFIYVRLKDLCSFKLLQKKYVRPNG